MYPGTLKKDITPQDTRACYFRSTKDQAVTTPPVSIPVVNISETATEYLIAVGAPGLYREDFNVEIKEGILSISAERETVEYSINDRWEYTITDWTRKFTLPENADAMKTHAKHENGELLIRIPRTTATENKVTLTVYVY